MIALIGAQSLVYNLTELDNYYKEVSLTKQPITIVVNCYNEPNSTPFFQLDFAPEDSYGGMVRKHSLWKMKQAAKGLLKPVDRFKLPMSATTVNAAYTFVKNALSE